VLTTNQKGAIAETAIIHEATKLGLGVFKSIADERYDLIFDLNPELIRVQCKTASKIGSVVVVRCYSNRRTATGMLSRAYTAEEIDALAAYCPDLGRCYLVPAARIDGRRGIQLRLDPTRNNQQLGVNWARDWEFAATLRREFGAIAQLGERLAGSQKVAGSSPAGSTFGHCANRRRDAPVGGQDLGTAVDAPVHRAAARASRGWSATA
jgi:hypothetical protein